jgi:hypothetical protein
MKRINSSAACWGLVKHKKIYDMATISHSHRVGDKGRDKTDAEKEWWPFPC